jgi:hypothetical protein
VVLILSLLISFRATAGESLDAYKKRFRIIRDEEGRALRIIDRSLHTRLSFNKFSKTYFDWFIKESPELSMASSFISPGAESESIDINRQLNLILEKVRKYKLGVLIQSSAFSKINIFLSSEFKKVSTVGFRTVSNLENTTFFFQKKDYRRIEGATKKEVAKYFPRIVDEMVVSYLVTRYIGFLRDSRTYHQSILLHYLTNFKAKDLGMNEQEVGKAISSVLEADIKIHNFISRRRLKRNWDRYGKKKLLEIAKESLKTVVGFGDQYQHSPFFANPYFARTKMSRGEEVWIIPYYQNKALDNTPSLSFDFSRPNFVYKKRRYYELILFAEIQSDSKKLKKYFTHLKFRRQMLKEGLLYGFYESKGDSAMMDKILKQSLNPLENLFKLAP